jgi:S-adenosyl-L-methionine hydrolase (adenosine-forming)
LIFAADFVDIFLQMSDELNPRKIIALLTDFGTKDYFVGALKGVITTIAPDVNIVDITHEIEPQNIASAGFTLRTCYKNFPKQTIFTAVVDPGVGSDRKAILVETEDYYFIAPDNGLLSFIFNNEKNFKVHELTNKKFFAPKVSTTFHGRDVFAPVAAHLSNSFQPDEFGRQIINYIRFDELKPYVESNGKIIGEIIHIDRFGNLVTNLTKEHLPDKFVAEVNNIKIDKIRNYYSEAEKSELFMVFGSAGFLEIVAFQNSAAKKIAAEIGSLIIVEHT